MNKKNITITDKKKYDNCVVENYTLLTQRFNNNTKHISIQGINIAIGALEIEDIYKEVLIVKYGLKDGIYKPKSVDVLNHLSKNLDVALIPKILSTTIKKLSSLKYQLYYDEEVKDMLNRFADLDGYISIKSFRYLELYCTVTGINLSDICSKVEPHTLLVSEIQKSLKSLKDIEYKVVVMRFGLNSGEPQSFSKIANTLYVSIDIVRGILKKALSTLKQSTIIENFTISNIDFKIATLKLEILKLEKFKQSLNKDIDLLNSDIEVLYLPVRTLNCLRRYGVKNIKELLALTKHDFLNIRNLGKKGQQEVLTIQQIIS